MAANMGPAITIGRCKMTEMEERLLKLGYPELDEIDPQAIRCEELETTKFTCETRVEKVEIPNPSDNSLGDGGSRAPPRRGARRPDFRDRCPPSRVSPRAIRAGRGS